MSASLAASARRRRAKFLTALLDGTSYNVVMVGDLPNGAPRELMLTRRTGGGASTPADTAQNQNPGQNGQNAQNGDDSAQDDTGNSGDDASDDGSPPMQYTPPSIAPAEPVPPTAQNPQNPRVAPPMQNAPE